MTRLGGAVSRAFATFLGILALLTLTLVVSQSSANAEASSSTTAACGDSFSVTGIRWSDVDDVLTPGLRRVTFRVNLVDVNRFLNGANGSSQTIVSDSPNTEFLGPYELPPSGNSVSGEFITTDNSVLIGVEVGNSRGTVSCTAGVDVADPRFVA